VRFKKNTKHLGINTGSLVFCFDAKTQGTNAVDEVGFVFAQFQWLKNLWLINQPPPKRTPQK